MARKGSKHVPEHLGPAGRAFWRVATEALSLEAYNLRILQTACEALDRAEECRARISEDGLTTVDRFGQIKPHPLLTAERDARALFLKAARDLGLNLPGEG